MKVFVSQKIDVNIYYRQKDMSDFLQVAAWSKIDMCKFAENVENYSMIKMPLIRINKTFGGLIHRCPYRLLNLRVKSINIDSFANIILNVHDFPEHHIIYCCRSTSTNDHVPQRRRQNNCADIQQP